MTDSPAPKRPDPVVERDNQFFWDAAKGERLVARACSDCGELTHPPLPMCPKCHSLSWTEKTLSGEGTITGWMRPHHPPTPFFDYPVLVITVRLAEGIALISNLVDAQGRQLQEGAVIGQPVKVAFAPTPGGWKVPVFMAATAAAHS